ncbi:MAG: CoA transferase, partial [Dehalococcoidia bacterium]|nr:CoA transferase [Dehalococcoidia bacterium]
ARSGQGSSVQAAGRGSDMTSPLDKLRVIDLGQVFAGPFAARLLADMGAEVVRVESPFRSGRGGAVPLPGATYPDGVPGERPYNRVAYYNEVNRNKRAVSLDLSKDKGREVFLRLVAISDVLVENFSPRVMSNLGLDYEVLRQRRTDLIMVSMSAFGSTGPYRDYVSFGPGVEAMAGFSSLMGYPGGPPLRAGVAYADAIGGNQAALAVLVALRHRQRTGEGQHIDLSVRESLVSLLGESVIDFSMNKRVPRPVGNRHPTFAPHGVYRCRGDDAWVAISVESEEEWQRCCRAMGAPGWTREPRFSDMSSRRQYQDELDRLMEGWTLDTDKYEAMRALQGVGVKAGAVLTAAELLEDRHLKERHFFQRLSHPDAGVHQHPGVAWRLSRSPGQVERAAPCFAQDNRYVFGELLGMSADEIVEMERDGVATRTPSR